MVYPGSVEIKKENFKDWPFYQDGVCLTKTEIGAIIVYINGGKYALNGVALSLGIPELPGDLWRNNEGFGGPKIPITEILNYALTNI